MELTSVLYQDHDTALTGWLVHPESKPRAAVLIFPTIMNATDNMKMRARMLADAGYVAMIADFYGQDVSDFDSAIHLATKLRSSASQYRTRLRAAVNTLSELAPGLPMAAIGYCMGGQAALELSRDGADLILCTSFHGSLDTQAPAQSGAVKSRILVCHGDADPMVPHEQVLAFWNEMNAAGANWHFHSYSGVKHGFTDPDNDKRGMPAIGYNASADQQSWASLMGMLDELLR